MAIDAALALKKADHHCYCYNHLFYLSFIYMALPLPSGRAAQRRGRISSAQRPFVYTTLHNFSQTFPHSFSELSGPKLHQIRKTGLHTAIRPICA